MALSLNSSYYYSYLAPTQYSLAKTKSTKNDKCLYNSLNNCPIFNLKPPLESSEPQLLLVLKSTGALKMKFAAPMPEQIVTPTMKFVGLPTCCGMGATNLNFRALDNRLYPVLSYLNFSECRPY